MSSILMHIWFKYTYQDMYMYIHMCLICGVSNISWLHNIVCAVHSRWLATDITECVSKNEMMEV